MRRGGAGGQGNLARRVKPVDIGSRAVIGGLGVEPALQHQRGREVRGHPSQRRAGIVSREPSRQQMAGKRTGEEQSGLFFGDHLGGQIGAAIVLRPADQADQRDRGTELRKRCEPRLYGAQLHFGMIQPGSLAAAQIGNHIGQDRARLGKVDQRREQIFRVRAKRLRQGRIGEQVGHGLFQRPVEIPAALCTCIALPQHLASDRIGDLRTAAEVVAPIVIRGNERIEDHSVERCGRGDRQRAQDQLRAVGDAIEIAPVFAAQLVHQQRDVMRGVGDATPFGPLQSHPAIALRTFLGRAQPRRIAGAAVIGHDQVEAGRCRAQRIDEGIEGSARFPRPPGDQPELALRGARRGKLAHKQVDRALRGAAWSSGTDTSAHCVSASAGFAPASAHATNAASAPSPPTCACTAWGRMKAVSATRKRGTVGKVSSCRKGINGTQEVMAAKAKPSSMTDPVTPTGG
eukprot:jgi/Psemu1/30546/gm1.30546_g